MTETLEIRDVPIRKYFRGFWLFVSMLVGVVSIPIVVGTLLLLEEIEIWESNGGINDYGFPAIGLFAISSATAYLHLKTNLGVTLSLVLVGAGFIMCVMTGAAVNIHPQLTKGPANQIFDVEHLIWLLIPPWLTTLGITCSKEFAVS